VLPCGHFGPLFLGIVGIVVLFFLFIREIAWFVRFIKLAVSGGRGMVRSLAWHIKLFLMRLTRHSPCVFRVTHPSFRLARGNLGGVMLTTEGIGGLIAVRPLLLVYRPR
jgi:hypothetical protein